jgi:cobalt-zinc-cadmium efflux system protein
MGAGHDHTHGTRNERSLKWALALTATVLVAEGVGAFLTNSLALLSDAAHMLTDVAALLIALIALRLAKRSADSKRTFGYYRFEILAAVVNAVLLFIAAVYILIESYQRLQNPREVASTGMLLVAAVGLIANLVSMRLLQPGAESSLNMKGAYLEVWSDALGSIGVIAAALLIHYTAWWQADPIVAILIGLWVLPRSWTLLSESVNILLEGVPQGLALDAIHSQLLNISGVLDVHDLHVWSISTGKNTLTAHLTLDACVEDEQRVLKQARAAIEEFGITHSTVQIEAIRCNPAPDCSLHSHHSHPH